MLDSFEVKMRGYAPIVQIHFCACDRFGCIYSVALQLDRGGSVRRLRAHSVRLLLLRWPLSPLGEEAAFE